MKKWILLILPFILCGCTHDLNRQEIDELNMVLALGIDYANGEYTVSALYSTGAGADPEKGTGSGEESIAEGTGKTVYEALEELKKKDKKTITLTQTGSYLIGDGAAEQDLHLSLDFLSRDETIKMEALLYVIKDKKASDFMKEGIENKQLIHEDMEAITQKQREFLTRNDNTLVNILNDMKQTNSSVLIPYLISEEAGFLIEGYAVFDELRLRDYLDQDTSNGVNFLYNIMRSYPIYLANEVSLLISYTKTKLKADLNNGGITITVSVNFETMIKEIITKDDVFTQEGLLRLTNLQNAYIQSIIEKPINYSKATGLDILHLARLIENQNSSGWQELEADWDTKISDIVYEYNLQSQITKSFILGQ